MKTCLICGEQCSLDAHVCSKCGEASWSQHSEPKEPEGEKPSVTEAAQPQRKKGQR